MNRFVTAFLVLILLSISTSHALADWSPNGNPVCRANGDQAYQKIISDGAGGGIIVWEDPRSTYRDVYTQRFSQDGSMLWQLDGVLISTADRSQIRPVIAEDGAGGGIIVWVDDRTGAGYDIYAQRINHVGSILWSVDGVPVCVETGEQHRPYVISDGAGGAIVAWHDERSGVRHIYAQRIDANGNMLWPANGVMISTPHPVATCSQEFPVAAPDESGGAIIVWHASCNDDMSDRELHIQRVDAFGDTLWSGSQTILTDFTGGSHAYPAIISDGSGGAIVAWTANEENVAHVVYTQRVSSSGDRLWGMGGQVVAHSNSTVEYPRLASDEKHGAFIVWTDLGENSVEGFYNLFIRRVQSDGTPSWDAEVMLADAYGNRKFCDLAPDGSGGVVTGWRDFRYHELVSDVFTQKVDSTGQLLWGPSGLSACESWPFRTRAYALLICDDEGGEFLCWIDFINDTDFDIYAKRVNPDYTPPEYEYPPEIISVSDVPGDQGGQLSIIWNRSFLDSDEYRDIAHYAVWRRISFDQSTLMYASFDTIRTPVPGPSTDPGERPILKYNPAGVAWEWLIDIPARFFDSYAATVPSLHDSTALGTGWQYFMVSAVTHDPYVFYDSPVDSGYSVDNLSPCTPTGLAIYPTAVDLLLEWNANTDADLLRYAVYRGDGEDFIPGYENLIASTTETSVVDSDWDISSVFYYKVSAIDLHGNESDWAVIKAECVISTQLQSFSSTWSSGSIVLTWTVSSLEDGTGFHISRSEDDGETWQIIEGGMIDSDGMTFTYVDRELLGGREYIYRVDISDDEGSRLFFVSEKVNTPEIPLTLKQNYPNPFNPSTTIVFYLPERTDVSLNVYDVSGRLIRALESGALGAGWHSAAWDGTSASGKVAVSGTYFYRLKTGKQTVTCKMVLLR